MWRHSRISSISKKYIDVAAAILSVTGGSSNENIDFHKFTTMQKKNFSALTDEELLEEKKKLKKSKFFSAASIGFLAGILIFGLVSWGLSSEKQVGFLIPMLIPAVFIYRGLKNPKNNTDLEEVLKERNLH